MHGLTFGHDIVNDNGMLACGESVQQEYSTVGVSAFIVSGPREDPADRDDGLVRTQFQAAWQHARTQVLH